MKKLIATALLGAGLLAGTAQAEQVGGLYIGITGGVERIDFDELDDGDMFGVVGGLRFANGLSLEAVLAKSESDAKADPGCTIDLDTLGVYGAFRSSGNVYFKARVGLLYEEATSSNACPGGKVSDDDTGLSLGAGAGVRFGEVAVEAEYTIVEQDVDRISLAFLYNF